MTTMFEGMTTDEIRADLVAKLQQNIENTDAMKPMIQEVDTHYPEVWEELVLEKKPKEQWDDDYFIELTTSFLMTCSKDTLLHAMEVGDVIAASRKKRRAERERKSQTHSTTQSYSSQSGNQSSRSSHQGGRDIPKIAGVVIGGIALIVLAYLLIK